MVFLTTILGLSSIIIVNPKDGSIISILEVDDTDCFTNIETTKKLISNKLMVKVIESLEYNGECKVNRKVDKIVINAVTGSFWTEAEIDHNNQASITYFVSINKFQYTPSEPIIAHKFIKNIDFSHKVTDNKDQSPNFFIRSDYNLSMAVLAFNSTLKYYCQIILFSLSTGYGNYI